MIPLTPYRNKTVAVLGLGISGLAACRSLLQSKANVLAWDDSKAALAVAKDQGIPVDNLYTVDFSAVDYLLISPGIGDEHPVAKQARENHCPIIGEVKLLADSVPHATYIGVTGTNGKSTTTALIEHMLKESNIPCAAGGNLGTPAISLPLLKRGGIYVLEMSSYMLERVDGMRFAIGVFLNLSKDHLKRHKTMEAYFKAKSKLFSSMKEQDTAIICTDDMYGKRLYREICHCRTVQVSYKDIATPHPYLKGRHNRQNVASAHAVGKALRLQQDQIEKSLGTFTGLPHRQQNILTQGAITFVNDSKATNAQAAANALSIYTNIYWIAGGQEKSEYTALLPYLASIKKAYLIGEGAKNLSTFLTKNAVDNVTCHTLDNATATAYRDSRRACTGQNTAGTPPATILLSPACASWDQFASYVHRGNTFIQCVKNITENLTEEQNV